MGREQTPRLRTTPWQRQEKRRWFLMLIVFFIGMAIGGIIG